MLHCSHLAARRDIPAGAPARSGPVGLIAQFSSLYYPSHPTTDGNLNMQYAQAMAYHGISSTAPAAGCSLYPAATNQPRGTCLGTCGWSGSTTCEGSRTSRRRLALLTVSTRIFSRWSMQRCCATCSPNSVPVASASFSRAATLASAKGLQGQRRLRKSPVHPLVSCDLYVWRFISP